MGWLGRPDLSWPKKEATGDATLTNTEWGQAEEGSKNRPGTRRRASARGELRLDFVLCSCIVSHVLVLFI
jgi:hypothetical protein